MLVSRKMIVGWFMILLCLSTTTVANAQSDFPEPVKPNAAADAQPKSTKKEAEQDSDQAPAEEDDKLYKVQEPLDPSKRSTAISIKGTVLKEDGEPARWSQVWLSGVVMRPSGRFRATQLAFVRADKNGEFEFWHPSWQGNDAQSGEHVTLWVIARTRSHRLTSNVPLNLTDDFRGKKQIHGLMLKEGSSANYSGYVVNADGDPIPKSKIQPRYIVLPSPPGARRQNAITMTSEMADEYSTVTDADGKFTLVGLPESTYISVNLITPDATVREVRWGTQAEPEIKLQHGGIIRGQIANRPAKDFTESVELAIRSARNQANNPVEPRISFETKVSPQADGSFEISDVPPGSYELNIVAKRPEVSLPFSLQATVPCESKSGEVTNGIQVALPNLVMGHGQVVDDQTGNPVQGASLTFYLQQERNRTPIGSAITDENGDYRAFLPPGKIAIQPTRAPIGYLTSIDRTQPPAVEYLKDFEGPTFKLERAMVFRGSVVDTEGRPVANAEVKPIVPYRSGQNLSPNISTDDQGHFEIPQVDPHDRLQLRVRTMQAVSTPLVFEEDELANPPKIIVSPENVFRLKGTFTSQRGKPIANAPLSIHWHRRLAGKKTSTSGFGGELEKVTTDAEGKFESLPLWGGDQYHVAIDAVGFSKTDLPLVNGEPGHTHDYGTVPLKGTGQTIFGKVVDSKGKPIPSVSVFNSGDAADVVTTATDDLGRFQLTGLTDGPAYVFAEHSQYRFAGKYVSDSSNEIELKLTSLAEPPVERPQVDWAKLDATRQQAVDQLAAWVKEKNLPFRPVLDGYKFNTLASTDPDEAFKAISQLSKFTQFRNFTLIARHLMTSSSSRTDKTRNDPEKTKVALKFVEHAASLIDDLGPDYLIYSKTEAGLLFLRLGDIDRGKSLIETAAKDFVDANKTSNSSRANIAQGIARYDIPRALSFRDMATEDRQKATIRSAVIREVSRYDVPRAIELLNDASMRPNEDYYDDQLKFELVHWVGLVDPTAATRIIDSTNNFRMVAEAAGRAAVAIGDQNPELAHSLIDRGVEILRANRTTGSKTSYYVWLPAVAANLTVQAAQIKYPDMESLVQKTVALRLPAAKQTSMVGRLQATINSAMFLAFIDPNLAKQMLKQVEPELNEKMLGNGGSDSVGTQQWLYAWALADPDKAVTLLKAEMEKPREDGKPPYWIDGTYTLLALPKSEQWSFIQQFGGAGLSMASHD